MTAEGLSLHEGMTRLGMTIDQLWLDQLSLGGSASSIEVEAYVLGLLRADRHQHNLLAHAVNEGFMDRGGNHPVAYWDDDREDARDVDR